MEIDWIDCLPIWKGEIQFFDLGEVKSGFGHFGKGRNGRVFDWAGLGWYLMRVQLDWAGLCWLVNFDVGFVWEKLDWLALCWVEWIFGWPDLWVELVFEVELECYVLLDWTDLNLHLGYLAVDLSSNRPKLGLDLPWAWAWVYSDLVAE